MDKTTKETRRQSYDAMLPKREKRCRLILETLGAREMTASEITEELVAGERVSIVGFGSFDVKTRGERVGRNPRTREEITIPASRTPVFKAGKALKDAVAK